MFRATAPATLRMVTFLRFHDFGFLALASHLHSHLGCSGGGGSFPTAIPLLFFSLSYDAHTHICSQGDHDEVLLAGWEGRLGHPV